MRPPFRTATRRLAVAVLVTGVLPHDPLTHARATTPNDNRAIVHTLNRLAYGPRPGDIERIRKQSLATWIDQQLRPERIADPELGARLERLTTLTLEPEQLGQDFIAVRQERRRRQQATTQDRQPTVPPRMNDDAPRARQVLPELAEAKLMRAVYSERQLEEVLVDFWFNHFNVFARKGQTEIYVGEYERKTIRPHVLGNFRDLLGATAKSPAMLVYLDNWMSADPDTASHLETVARRGAATRDGSRRAGTASARRGTPIPPDGRTQGRMARGLNENYARELLELHTLGVDGGYTQEDVVAVARAFTGWTIGRPSDPGFRFVPNRHDQRAKTVLGQTIAAGSGVEDGETVLDILARHPATARHLSFKLAQRFVSDAPPPALVDRAARTFQRTNGNLREVVRTIVTSPEFFAPEAYRAKVKTPFEFVASALRALDAEVQSGQTLVRAVAALGMPLYLCQPPTGYDETADTWVSSGALVNRMNFALAIAGGQTRGVVMRPVGAVAGDGIVRQMLAGDVSPATLETVGKATSGEQALALALGSPEFQRQ